MTTPTRHRADWPSVLSAGCFAEYLRERRAVSVSAHINTRRGEYAVCWGEQEPSQ